MTEDKSVREQIETGKAAVAANPDSAKAHLKLGTTLLRAGHQRDAEASIRKATELDPGFAEAWVNLGGLLFTRWDFNGSVEANKKAVEVGPNLPMAHYNLGLGYLYLKQAEPMVECFRRVIELDPSNAGGHYHLAVGLNDLGRVDEAVVSLEQAKALGYSPDPALLKAIDKALKNKEQGEGVLTVELGGDPDGDDQDKP